MGWFSGPKCGDCGATIAGPKFSHSAFGKQFWVCAPCEEKRKAELAREKEKADQARAKQQGEQASAQPKSPPIDMSTIPGRSDIDIAEALSKVVPIQYAMLINDVTAVAGKDAKPKSIDAYIFVLASVSYAFRRWQPLPIDAARHDRIEENLVRFTLADFIHCLFVNPPPALGKPAPDRQKLLAELMTSCPAASKAHQQNIANALRLFGEKNHKAFLAWLSGLARVHLFELQNSSDTWIPLTDPRSVALTQCMWRIVERALGSLQMFAQTLASLSMTTNSQLALELPETWLLRQRDPYLYYDPCTPQYNFLVTILSQPTSNTETPAAFVKRVIASAAPGAEPAAIDDARAIAQYRSNKPETGQAKDDYHWCLADKETGVMRAALFTLSVLSSHADSMETEALAATLTERIRQSRFLD